MKGYNLSTDYKLLWELCNNGYRIAAWYPYTEFINDMVEVKMNYDKNGLKVGYRGQTIIEELDPQSFLEQCGFYNLQYIMPEHDLK